MMNDVRYSVVVPSYNSEKTILPCLEHLSAQDLDEPYEVIVVDSSQDATAGLIAKHHPQVKLIRREKKTDQGRARNLGVKAASGELIFFLDSDCLVPPHWISTIINWQKKGYQAVGGPILIANPESSVAWAGYLLEFNDLLPPKEPRDVWHLPSGNVCYRRSFLDEYGPYPENLNFALEDYLFHADLRDKNIMMVSVPRIGVRHFHRESLYAFLKHQFKLGRGQCQMMRKIPMEGSTFVRYPWLIGIWVLSVLPFVKFFRTSIRFYAWDRKQFFRKPAVFPSMAVGLVSWIFGFGREMLFPEKNPARAGAATKQNVI